MRGENSAVRPLHVEERWVNQGAVPIKLLVLGLHTVASEPNMEKKYIVRYVQSYLLSLPICSAISSVDVNERDVFNPIYLRDTFKTEPPLLVVKDSLDSTSDEGLTIMSNLTNDPITCASHTAFKFGV